MSFLGGIVSACFAGLKRARKVMNRIMRRPDTRGNSDLPKRGGKKHRANQKQRYRTDPDFGRLLSRFHGPANERWARSGARSDYQRAGKPWA